MSPSRERSRVRSLIAVTFLLAGMAAQRSAAQCTVGAPNQFVPPNGQSSWGPNNKFETGSATSFDLFTYQGAHKLLMRENYGYTIWDLANPATPSSPIYCDVESSYPRTGDVFYTVAAVSAAPDGSRIVVGYRQPHGNLLMVRQSGSPGCTYNFAGEFNQPRAADNFVIQRGSRYIGFGTIQANSPGVSIADVTTPLSGAAAKVQGSLPNEYVYGTDGAYPSTGFVAGNYVVYGSNSSFDVMDTSNPGPALNISSGFRVYTFTAADVGLPAGDSIQSVAGVIHPVDGKLYMMVQGGNTTTYVSDGYVLVSMDSTGNLRKVGARYSPPAPWISVGMTTGVATANDVVFFGWTRSSDVTQQKLVSLTAGTWPVDQSPNAVFDYLGQSWGMKTLSTGTNQWALYTVAYSKAFAQTVSCSSSATSPATSDVTAALVNPSTGATTPLSAGSTVFLGDTVQVTPIVTPAASQQPITDWKLDLDYHSATESNGTAYPRLRNADVFYTSIATSPSALTLVGPCDPNVSGTTYSTGIGCWNSVQSNATWGGPDFTAAPAAGTTKTLTFALEAKNVNGSANLKTFDLVWKVPAVKLASTAILLNAALTDASEGHPTGYKWYFGTDPAAPLGESLTLDSTCTNKATCSHAFARGKGSYNYWLTVSYAGGYSSPDYSCGATSGFRAGAAATAATCSLGTIAVTDVVLNFTNAPTTLLKSVTSFSLSSQSTQASGISSCGNGLEYDVCIASDSACTAAGGPTSGWTSLGTNIAGAFTIAMPATMTAQSTYWLRIRYNYATATAGCSAALRAPWTPAVSGVSDPTAWPIGITDVQPTVIMSVNGNPCATFGQFSYFCDAKTGDQLQAVAQINGATDTGATDLTWNVTPTPGPTPSTCQQAPTVNCNPFNFSISRTGTYTLTMHGYGGFSAPAWTIGVTSGSPLTIGGVYANPSTAAINTQISFTASVSGGSAPYTYSWTFGDGQSSTQAGPSHSYASASTYPVRLTVTDSSSSQAGPYQTSVNITGGGGGTGGTGGSLDFVVTNTATGSPADILFGKYLLTSNTSYTFQPTGGNGSYSWNFGDSQQSSGGDITHTYYVTTQTNYTVVLSSGSTVTHGVVVAPAGGGGTGGGGGGGTPVIDFGLVDTATGTNIALEQNHYTVNSGQDLTFVPSPTGYAMTWDFGDGSATSIDASPHHTYTSVTNATRSAKVTNSANVATAHVIWVMGSAGAPLTGNYTFMYDVDGSNVNVGAVPANKVIKFTGVDAADTYTWDFGDGSAVVTGSPATHSYPAEGDWTVRLSVFKAGQSVTTTPSPTTFHVLPPPEPQQWVVAGMVYNDSWQSDLTIFNPSTSQPMTVSLAFLDSVAPVWDPNQLQWGSLTLAKGASKTYTNVLQGPPFLAPKGHWGAILVRGDMVPSTPVFTARTYSTATTGGTFGLSVPASSTSAGVKPQASGASSRLIGLKENDKAYTNLAFVNLKADNATVEVKLFDATGTQLGTAVSYGLTPYGVLQVAHILSTGAGYQQPADAFSASIRLVSGTAIFPYATVIDSVSKDPIVVTPQLKPASTYRMPGVVRVQGANDTVWRSDVVVYNASTLRRKVNVSYLYRTPPDGPMSQPARITLEGGQSLPIADFVQAILQLPEGDTTPYSNSWIDFSPAVEDDGTTNTDPLLVIGKTYNNQPTGNVGLQVPGFTGDDGASQTGSKKRLLLTGLRSTAVSTSGYRTNLAFFLLPGTALPQASATVNVFDGTGNLIRQAALQLDSVTGFYQMNDGALFGDLPADKRSQMSVVVDNITGNATIAGYATIVDNVSGDGTFVQAVPAN